MEAAHVSAGIVVIGIAIWVHLGSPFVVVERHGATCIEGRHGAARTTGHLDVALGDAVEAPHARPGRAEAVGKHVLVAYGLAGRHVVIAERNRR